MNNKSFEDFLNENKNIKYEDYGLKSTEVVNFKNNNKLKAKIAFVLGIVTATGIFSLVACDKKTETPKEEVKSEETEENKDVILDGAYNSVATEEKLNAAVDAYMTEYESMNMPEADVTRDDVYLTACLLNNALAPIDKYSPDEMFMSFAKTVSLSTGYNYYSMTSGQEILSGTDYNNSGKTINPNILLCDVPNEVKEISKKVLDPQDEALNAFISGNKEESKNIIKDWQVNYAFPYFYDTLEVKKEDGSSVYYNTEVMANKYPAIASMLDNNTGMYLGQFTTTLMNPQSTFNVGDKYLEDATVVFGEFINGIITPDVSIADNFGSQFEDFIVNDFKVNLDNNLWDNFKDLENFSCKNRLNSEGDIKFYMALVNQYKMYAERMNKSAKKELTAARDILVKYKTIINNEQITLAENNKTRRMEFL